ncbi:hypothetical protein N7455_003212 [Penicillium solitum]|uniref:uncharacterized protein n=1 Tax=Penicillium solitum TaxID=60172 RepID=UPI0032C3F902|nr:hypothetical protein N7455_003212 [Penicillium solitum]
MMRYFREIYPSSTSAQLKTAYTSGIGGCLKTRSLLAELLNKHFYPATQVEPAQIILAAGGSFALTALVDQICNPGDGILIAAPYWAGLDISISIHGHANIIPVHVPLSGFFGPESVKYYESALENASIPIRAILVCNPHNPLGQCYPRETLQALLDFCRRRDLHYISDEVYALSAHQPPPAGFSPFVSILQFVESQMSERTHVIYSLSKDFGCNGIRLGALISQSNQAVRLSAALSLHSQVSSLSTVFASETILKDNSIRRICEHGGKRLRMAYEVITLFLKTHEIEFIPAAYGMFVFARLCPVKTVQEEQELLGNIKSMGVSVSSGTSYHFEEPGWFRLCYGVPLDQLEQALRRIYLGMVNYGIQ